MRAHFIFVWGVFGRTEYLKLSISVPNFNLGILAILIKSKSNTVVFPSKFTPRHLQQKSIKELRAASHYFAYICV